MNPADIASEALLVSQESIVAIERIKGGLTNESWLVQTHDDAVVVRISTADERALQIDRESEARILAYAQAKEIGATVLLCVPERRLLVTRKIPGRTWGMQDAREPTNVVRVAELIKELHACNIADVHRLDLQAIVEGYWQELHGSGRIELAGSDKDRQRAMQIAGNSTKVGDYVFCHNDIHHLNVIDNGNRLWLLDWEYAGLSDPFFDLASVCCYHHYEPELRLRLLRAYLGADHASEFDRLEQMCWLFDYIKELWLAVREKA